MGNTDSARETGTVGQALAQARSFDRARVSTRAGVVAALPVVAMLSIGALLGSPSAAVTMGAGAMLAGVAWRAGGGPLIPPLGAMVGATGALAVATLAGTLSGHWAWLHLLLLAGFCLLGGAATTLGRSGGVIGVQSIIAFIVFGRFPQSVGNAFALTGLVIAGGAVQCLFAATVAVPLAWRRQRQALADAYRLLISLAPSEDPAEIPSSADSAAALEAADAALRGPALFADPNRDTLAALVREGRRIRLELVVLRTILAQQRRVEPGPAHDAEPQIEEALDRVRALLELTVVAIAGDAAALGELAGDAAALGELAGDADALGVWGARRTRLRSPALDERLAALTGQVRAAARLAAALRPPRHGARSVPLTQPSLGFGLAVRRLRYGARRLRGAASPDSAAGRHALRLAVVVPLTGVLAQLLTLPRGYWAAVAATTVLRPSFGQTFTRGAERVLGTLAGVVLASVIAVAIDPGGWGVVAVVGILAFGAYAVYPASYAAGLAILTGMIVFLLHAVAPDSGQIALDRGIDTAIGVAIGLSAYRLWPTWSALQAGALLARLVDAQRVYLDAVLHGLESGRLPADARLRTLARAARIAYADADATIGLALSEPERGDADPRAAAETLGSLRRVVYAIHALRLELAGADDAGIPRLELLRWGVSYALGVLAARLRRGSAAPLPRLRSLHGELGRAASGTLSPTLWAELDELVDAVNTAAATAGLEIP